MKPIDNVLDEISRHPLEEKEIISEILYKRVIEEKRELIYRDYKRAMNNYKIKHIKSGNTDDLFREINK